MPTEVNQFDRERAVRDVIQPRLGSRAIITWIKHEEGNNRIAVHVVSPNDFEWTANELKQLCPRAAEVTGCEIVVQLKASWRPKKAIA